MSDRYDSAELTSRIDAFLAGVPDLLRDVDGELARARRYRAALFDAGLAGLDIPREFGGGGLNEQAAKLFRQRAAGRVPREDGLFTVGVGMGVHIMIRYAEPEISRTYAPRMLRGDDVWCQMYSEPSAGSDLAGLRTRATRSDDGDWLLSGQKVWTSRAEIASYGICLARTNPDVAKHKGISMFVVPFDQPGVTVRPITQITGTREFNEIFLDEAVVPANHLIGEVDRGWPLAIALMRRERLTIGDGGGRQPVALDRLREQVIAAGRADDPHVAQQYLDCYVSRRIADLTARRQAQMIDSGIDPGAETSLGKLWRSLNGRLAADLLAEVSFGPEVAWSSGDERERAVFDVLDSAALSLGGGTDEVQKNTIAEQLLGLPRDPWRESVPGATTEGAR